MGTVDYIPEEEQDDGYFLSSDEESMIFAMFIAFGKPWVGTEFYTIVIDEATKILHKLSELMTSDYTEEEIRPVVEKSIYNRFIDDDDIPF